MSSVIQPARNAHPWDFISYIDPRARILAAVIFSVTIAAVHGFTTLVIALAASLIATFFSGMSWKTVFKRLLPLNTIMLLLIILLPISSTGKIMATIGPISFSQEGFLLAIRIALQGNAIMLAILILLGTMEINTLGHALSHLRVPDKISHILLFTIRYLDVLHREYLRLRAAMKVRGFRPSINRHTYRSLGYLLGMLLIRSIDRSERIMAAMKCRGFRGRFYLLEHFTFHFCDLYFCLASVLILLTMLAVERI